VDSIAVEQRCCRGEWGASKSDASSATIAVHRAVIERNLRLRTLVVEVKAGRPMRRDPAVKSDGAYDLVFSSPAKGVPMRDNNVLVRRIKPAARKQGIPWVNWQVLGRSFAAWLKPTGADIKDPQALMRHSRVSTTLEIYQ
jgi:site-specific recombinase XerD